MGAWRQSYSAISSSFAGGYNLKKGHAILGSLACFSWTTKWTGLLINGSVVVDLSGLSE